MIAVILLITVCTLLVLHMEIQNEKDRQEILKVRALIHEINKNSKNCRRSRNER